MLVDAGVRVSDYALYSATIDGYSEAVAIFIEHMPDDPQGERAVAFALGAAASLWLPGMVRSFLEWRPSLQPQTLDDALLCLCATIQRDPEAYQPGPAWGWERAFAVTRLLLDAGASPSRQHHKGLTPLHFAARQLHLPRTFIRLPIEHGANVNARDKRGSTPLHYALESADCRNGTVHEMVLTGADLHIRNISSGNTLLHLAINAEVAKLFLDEGAEIDAKNDAGETPLDVARQAGKRDVVNVLLDQGARTGFDIT